MKHFEYDRMAVDMFVYAVSEKLGLGRRDYDPHGDCIQVTAIREGDGKREYAVYAVPPTHRIEVTVTLFTMDESVIGSALITVFIDQGGERQLKAFSQHWFSLPAYTIECDCN